jgi:hypothetical protein
MQGQEEKSRADATSSRYAAMGVMQCTGCETSQQSFHLLFHRQDSISYELCMS